MTKILVATLFCFLTFLWRCKSSPITPVTQPSSSSSPRMPMDLCPDIDFAPGTKVSKATNCLPHQEMALQGLPDGHLPTAAAESADPCHWYFQCRTDAARTSTASTSGQKDAFWWEAVFKTQVFKFSRLLERMAREFVKQVKDKDGVFLWRNTRLSFVIRGTRPRRRAFIGEKWKWLITAKWTVFRFTVWINRYFFLTFPSEGKTIHSLLGVMFILRYCADCGRGFCHKM